MLVKLVKQCYKTKGEYIYIYIKRTTLDCQLKFDVRNLHARFFSKITTTKFIYQHEFCA